jgi:hypothetical protein
MSTRKREQRITKLNGERNKYEESKCDEQEDLGNQNSNMLERGGRMRTLCLRKRKKHKRKGRI